ncbi:MAG: hypothetical protein WAM79_08965 [Candidatus Sulfotelmatobacter sp.]
MRRLRRIPKMQTSGRLTGMAAKKKAKKKGKKKKAVAKKTGARRASSKKSSRKVSRPKKTPKQKPAARSRRSSRARPGPERLITDSDSQGLSTAETADSESVSELIDEGNAFEAGVVEGVEKAEDAGEREVRTREFPEDDVPEEYLDKD